MKHQTTVDSALSGVRFRLKAYTVTELAKVYGVSYKTFARWLKPFKEAIGERQGYYFNIAQVKCIITTLGAPGEVVVD